MNDPASPSRSSESPTRAPKTRRRLGLGGCLLISVAMVLLIVVILAGGVVAWRSAGARRVAKRIDELKAQGEPVTVADLDALYQLDAGQTDSTAKWLAAHRALAIKEYDSETEKLPIVGTGPDIPPPGQPWPQKDDVARYLAELEGAMAEVHAAAREGGAARYDLAFTQGFALELPHAQTSRQVARVLALEAHVRAHEGDVAGVIESLGALRTVGRSLEREPVIISQLIRFACDGMTNDLALEMMTHLEFTEDDLRRLQEGLRETDYRRGLQNAMRGERILAMGVFQGHTATPEQDIPIPLSYDDFEMYLDINQQLVDAAAKPWPDARKGAAQIEQTMQQTASSPMNRLRFMRTMLIAPATTMVFEAATRTTADVRLLDLAIAIELFQRRENRFPAGLDELVPDFLPAIPLDPFDGKPLRYRPADEQVVIYSIGGNDADDGGVEDDNSGQPDQVMTLQKRH